MNLHQAAIAGDLEQVKAALSNSDINAIDEKGYTALMCAVLYDQQTILNELIQRGADPNVLAKDSELSALMMAALSDNKDSLQALLNYEKTNVMLTNVMGNSALLLAVIQGNTKAVELLAPLSDIYLPNYNGDAAFELSKDKMIDDILAKRAKG